MLYMAYGMNTNRDAMAVRCPKAKPLGGFYLPDTRLVFRGVADIVPDMDTICPVVLWEITHDCLRALDKLEGYPHLYNRRKINTDWIVYEMNDKSRTSPPNGGYYKMIEDGYKDFGLDDYCLRVALSEAEEVAA
jgi:gamma-glutamylcyclotransferase (GGCT)/AIG2-like uncharacterized protein YtfP